jgi:hypothetical protein
MNGFHVDDAFEDDPDDFDEDDEDRDEEDDEDDDEDDDVETWQVGSGSFPLRYGLRLTSGLEPA